MRIVGFKRRIGMPILPFINEALEVWLNDIYIKPFVGSDNTKIVHEADNSLIAVLNKAKDNPEKL